MYIAAKVHYVSEPDELCSSLVCAHGLHMHALNAFEMYVRDPEIT